MKGMILLALDGIYLYSILSELRSKLIGGKINKVNQPEKDELSVVIRGNDNSNYKLLISASSSYPKIHLTNSNKTNPLKAPMFCMVLRKYFLSSRIVNIRQVDCDRILIIDVESLDELGFNSGYSLVVEIMGRHSNITLIRQRDNSIMDCIKHITPDINRYRSLYPGITYVYPPKSEKFDPFNFNYDKLKTYVVNNNIELDEKMYFKLFTGVSKPFSRELNYRFNSLNVEKNLENIFEFLQQIFNTIKGCDFQFVSYSLGNVAKDFYCLKLSSLKDMTEKEYTSPSTLLENFYFNKDKCDRLGNYSSELQRVVHTNIDRCSKKESILNDNLLECKNKDEYRLSGELLTANIFSIKKGLDEVTLQNYYSEDFKTICIKLNPNKTPSENIQTYYKKYTKLKKTEEMSTIQLKANHEETEYLQSVLTNINNCETYEEIEEIKKELIETGYIKHKKKGKTKKTKDLKPLHFVSSDGIDIYVGKNNIQNDFLTLKFADKRDIWMHTKTIPGSHVIVKNMGSVPDKTLEEAAGLAAYYSKAKDSVSVSVDYTEVRNVKKPSGAKPGMVIYLTNKTINIIPKKLEK